MAMPDKVQTVFLLSRYYRSLFDSVASYHEMTKVDLLRRWMAEAAGEIVQLLVDSYEKSEVDDVPLLSQAKEIVVQVTLDELDTHKPAVLITR